MAASNGENPLEAPLAGWQAQSITSSLARHHHRSALASDQAVNVSRRYRSPFVSVAAAALLFSLTVNGN